MSDTPIFDQLADERGYDPSVFTPDQDQETADEQD